MAKYRPSPSNSLRQERKMLMRAAKIAYLSFSLIVLCLILHIVVLSVPSWVLYSNGVYSSYFGLWRYCYGNVGGETCVSTIGNPSVFNQGWYVAVQALQCLSLIVILAAAVCSGISVFLSIHERILNMTTIILMNTAAVFILIGSIIFGSRVDSIPSTVNLAHYLYVPYYFNIVCGVLSALAGACMLKYKVEYSF
uniref:Epithelial membrane protein 2 n=1 Tax=Magallana gigas TaxID=29159 RepID=A0A8W8L5U2_MAGGI|nr:uncharacterized protein LOC105342652 [Crassostrea gigas]